MKRPVALITGASSGLGAEFARQLAPSHDLVLVARRQERLEQLAASLPTSSRLVAADLTVPSEIERIASLIREEDRLELLVNNAGFGTLRRFWEAPLETQLRMHQLHVMAVVELSHAALEGLVRRDRGAIINVASVAGFARSPTNTSYCATKAWMVAFTEGLALDLGLRRSQVKVQALCPGFTYTEFHDVLGVDRSRIPASWWMSAEQVVAASLRGLSRGRLIVIPGWRYRLLVSLLTRLPMRLRMALQARAPHTRHRL